MIEEEGYIVEKKEVIETVSDEGKNTVTETQTIHQVTDDEKQPLVESVKEKCCTHVYLVVVKGLVTVFVIPLFIITSIIAWAVWLILLPVTCCCPCCEICTAIIKFIWKFLSTVPVYLSEWVCNKESDDDRYQMARKKRRKARHVRKLKKHTSYSTMETQTALCDLDGAEEGDLPGCGMINGGFNGTQFSEMDERKGEAKKVTFNDDIGLLRDGMDVNKVSEDDLLDCDSLANNNQDNNIPVNNAANGDEAYMSCTDNDDSETASEQSDDLLYIE